MFDTMTTGPGNPRVEVLDALVMGEQALRLEILTEITRLETGEVWKQDGATSMADWLAGRYTTSIGTAREWTKVARALSEQPHIKQAYTEGRLSWDQLRALFRFTTPDDEAEWAQRAPSMTVAVRRAVNKTVASAEAVQAHQRRRVEWWFDDHQPMFQMTVQMGDVEGATLATWLTRRANQYDPDPQSGVYEEFETRCADALCELASQAIAADRDHDRATIPIHTNLQTLLNATATPTIADGPALAHDTLRRLACDARLQLAITNPDGIVGVGRTTRTIPPWLARLIRLRDQHCRFPLCRRTRWTHAHHITHWADGGPTNLNNLITLCGHHHRLINEHGWTINGHPDAEITCFAPRLPLPTPTDQPPAPTMETHPRPWVRYPATQPTHPNPPPPPTLTRLSNRSGMLVRRAEISIGEG